jgi:hypothetical protein
MNNMILCVCYSASSSEIFSAVDQKFWVSWVKSETLDLFRVVVKLRRLGRVFCCFIIFMTAQLIASTSSTVGQ